MLNTNGKKGGGGTLLSDKLDFKENDIYRSK
jgi:hypothetical protein